MIAFPADFPTDSEVDLLAQAVYDVENRTRWDNETEAIRGYYRDSVRRAIGSWIAGRSDALAVGEGS